MKNQMFLKDGWFTTAGSLGCFFTGITIVGLVVWLEPNKIVYVFFLTIGLVLVGLAGAFGGFATFDNVISQAYARNQLAITNEFKRDVGYVVELQITKPTNAQIGHVGTQNSGAVGGGGNQLNFLITGGERASTFQYVNGSGRVLP